MKTWALCLAAFCSTAAIAQTTNKEGSNYKFTVIKNLDAGDVENQGTTGTCWSFSGLSFFQAEALRIGKGKNINLSEM